MAVTIEVLPDDSLAEGVARAFATIAATAIRERGEFVVALSGGSTPRAMYAALAAEPFRSSVDWRQVRVCWSDERCVPPEHESSNYRMARESLLDHVPLPGRNIHRIRGEDDPVAAAAEYERLLRSMFHAPAGPPTAMPGRRFDLVLLGLGTDGHTASLFPGAESTSESSQWVRAEYIPAVSAWRVTLTPIVIAAAAEVMFLVSGPAKAEIVRDVIEGAHRPSHLPAQLIMSSAERVRWLLDTSAAQALRPAR